MDTTHDAATTTAVQPAAPHPVLPAPLRLGPVHLTVTDLDRSVDFYERAIGLDTHARDDTTARMGAGERDALVLVEQPDARRAGRHAGLYHVALLYPSRLELARQAQRLAVTRTPVEGASDHHTHEAFYLPDPDGNGLELAADRPRDQWPDMRNDPYSGRPDPLDTDSLLALVATSDPVDRVEGELGVGHLHLHVGDVEQALAFYRDVIGFEEQMRIPSAGFVSAGGYHHHVGFNTWRGDGVPALPADVVGLRHWSIELPTAEDVAAVRERAVAAGAPVQDRDGGFVVRDPWDMQLEVRTP